MKKLSQRQQQQIQHHQQQHLQASEKGLVVTRSSHLLWLETAEGEHYQCNLRRNMPDIVVGDRVAWKIEDEADKRGTILAVEPRSSEMLRYDQQGKSKLVAANVNQLLIIIAPEPERSLYVIDRYLVIATLQNIAVTIVYNKMDLLTAGQNQLLREQLHVYQQLGYPVIFTSIQQADGLASLLMRLNSKTSVLVGVSGVGKSSLINALLPHERLVVGDLSEQGRQGQHTTTAAHLYHLPGGGDLIDSPGVRELAITGLTPAEILRGFVEFQPFVQQCKFRNCQHDQEPDCAVKIAVENGDIHPERWKAYQNMMTQE